MRAAACLFLVASLGVAAPVPKPPPPDPLGKGYMGVYAGGDQNSLTISRVEPNTPAARAGLRAGDAIYQVGFLTPQNFDDVRSLVGSLRPGTRVEMVVLRGGDRVTIGLELGNRPDTFERVEIEP